MASAPALEASLDISKPEPRVSTPAVLIPHPSIRIPELDGLRGIAILLVLLCHAVFELQPSSRLLSAALAIGRLSWSGVDLFFVLSGFLIGGILLDARDSPRYFQTFYIRRAFRILPLYGLALALFSLRFLTHHAAGPLGSFSPSAVSWLSYATFTQNISMALAGTFGVGTMAATWSLAVEEQFYLTIPWIIRKSCRKYLPLIPLGVVIVAPVVRIALHAWYRYGNFAAYVLTPCRADTLSMGVLCALLVRTPFAWRYVQERRSILRGAAFALLLGLVVLNHHGAGVSNWSITFGYSLLAVFYAVCLLLAISVSRGWCKTVLRSRALGALGTISYCLYLIHLPLMEASRRVVGLGFNYSSDAVQFTGGILGVALSVAVAAVSWRYLEKPLLRRGHAYRY